MSSQWIVCQGCEKEAYGDESGWCDSCAPMPEEEVAPVPMHTALVRLVEGPQFANRISTLSQGMDPQMEAHVRDHADSSLARGLMLLLKQKKGQRVYAWFGVDIDLANGWETRYIRTKVEDR